MGEPESFRIQGLTGREYKIMLEPKRFAGAPAKAARRFWKRLAPIVARHMDGKAGPGSFDEVFKEAIEDRPVQFCDTAALLLDAHGYSLRIRDKDAKRQVSLKLRTPDMLVSGLAALGGSSDDADPKFEEGIAPLEVQRSDGTAMPSEPSIRSRFSRSTKQPLAPTARVASLADAYRMFPDLRRNLTAAIGRPAPRTARLLRGPPISEYVFKSKDVRLNPEAEIAFAITLGYFHREPGKTPLLEVAEISFAWKLETPEAEEDEREETGRWQRNRLGATRNLDLFLAIQRELSGWIDKNNASKTKLGLPGRKPRRRPRSRVRRPMRVAPTPAAP